jgi:EAL domain-containing protein (putative c-di-GMP-specific phosphodiesterase class I)
MRQQGDSKGGDSMQPSKPSNTHLLSDTSLSDGIRIEGFLPGSGLSESGLPVCDLSGRIPASGCGGFCDILKQASIQAVYQPIVSVVQQRVVGVEGLSRGMDPVDGAPVSPLDLFARAEELDRQQAAGTPCRNHALCILQTRMRQYDTWRHRIMLDRLCRNRCLEGFRPLFDAAPETQLFLNLDASIIDAAAGSDYLMRQAEAAGIPPENIVIELNESHIQQVAPLVRFVNRYRKAGFLIALDDMGAGFSNLDRISLLEPDIIKLDRSLVQGVTRSYHKQEVFRCMVGLANKVGAIVVAEGVECAYILDDTGIQATETVFGPPTGHGTRRRGFVFSPAHVGSDHSLKKYCYELQHAGTGKYVSDPYISHATGSVCVTYSRIFHQRDGTGQILCLDYVQDWTLKREVAT